MRNSTRVTILRGVLVLLLSSPICFADTVYLNDGSRLVGTIERLGDAKLIINTQFAGLLQLDPSLVTSVSSKRRMVMELTTGDRLVGPIESSPDQNRMTVMTQMGGIPVSMEAVGAIWELGGKSPEVLAMEERIADERTEFEAKQPHWTAQLEAGASYTEGNTETLYARAAINVERTTDLDLIRFYFHTLYAEEDKERNTSEVVGGAYYEHLIRERFFAYASTELEYDEFENLDLRLTAALGGGYYWIKKPEHELKTRAGFSYLHESFRDDFTRDTPQLDLGLNYRVDIAPWLRFVHSTTYYPTFEELRDYRLTSDNALLIPLGKSDVWKLKLGAEYDYDPIPRPGFERLDQKYYANIVAEIK